MIAGLEELDDGDIVVGNREISRLSPRDRHIGMMFQGYALYPHLSVRENLAYPLRVRHAPRKEIGPRVAEAARLLGIEHLLERRIQQVSGGEQQQRVAIGRAIVQKPNLYLLDEPINNLSASLRAQSGTQAACSRATITAASAPPGRRRRFPPSPRPRASRNSANLDRTSPPIRASCRSHC